MEESYQEEEVKIEEAFKEVEVVKEEHKGVELEITLPKLLETPPPKLPSSFTTFKWVKFISPSFLIPLEYGLLETDGQLRALCGIKSKRKMVSGKNYPARFIMVGSLKFKRKGWCKAQLNGSRKLFDCLRENSDCLPPGWNNIAQQEDGCKSKVCDPGIHFGNQHSWGLVTCFNLLEGFLRLIWDTGGHWNYKHWWGFKDQYKHKPP